MITANQLVAHAVGDYILQSDWMANNKTKKSIAALCHVLTYALPFLFLRPSLPALAVIVSTHFVIDRWRLARYVVWAKNWLGGPQEFKRPFSDDVADALGVEPLYSAVNLPWRMCKGTGYPPATPAWLAVWLLIIADNVLHVLINGLALRFL